MQISSQSLSVVYLTCFNTAPLVLKFSLKQSMSLPSVGFSVGSAVGSDVVTLAREVAFVTTRAAGVFSGVRVFSGVAVFSGVGSVVGKKHSTVLILEVGSAVGVVVSCVVVGVVSLLVVVGSVVILLVVGSVVCSEVSDGEPVGTERGDTLIYRFFIV